MPVHVVITGCVRGGVFLSEFTDFGTHVSPGGYGITLVTGPQNPVNLDALEGRRISMTGELLPGDRFLIEEETLVDRGPCDVLEAEEATPADASAPGRKFLGPKVGGVPLDYCLEWGVRCGRPSADAWCRARGYVRASTFEVRVQAPPTRILSTGRVCGGADCDRIISLTCIGGGGASSVSPRETGSVGEQP